MDKKSKLIGYIREVIGYSDNSDYIESLDEYDEEELIDDILHSIQESISTFKLSKEIGYNSDKN